MYSPTDPQLDYIEILGYKGEPPVSKEEASFLIDGLKAGKKPPQLERSMLKTRPSKAKRWLRQEKRFVKMELQQARDSAGGIAGFRIEIGHNCEGAKQYDMAFLPTQVALKHPELLPPYEGICEYGKCECVFEPLLEDEMLSLDTRMIVGTDKVTTIRKHRRSRPGCFQTLFVLVVLAILIYWLARATGCS